MNILWIKDGKKGHEKQIEALIYEFSTRTKVQVVEIDCSTNFKNWPQNFKDYPDILIGAGNKTYPLLLDTKKYQKNNTKTVAVLTPSFKKDKF